MTDCGHVFCRQCLQDFYNNAIKEGDLVSVKCLDPSCAKQRLAAAPHRKKPRTQLGPSELLQIPLEPEVVTRYVKLKHKAELESDKNTIYCPRKWCQGAARSKKHRKPNGLEDTESEDEDDATQETTPTSFARGKDLLAVCEDCSFAFCSRCYQGWHGEFTICIPQTSSGELTEEDKASLEYLKKHSTPCPTCSSRAQKTHGCNHMICFKCNSHFCYLCSAWLDAGNPYKHYNEDRTMCYMRLWELEEGDGDEDDRARDRFDRQFAVPEEDDNDHEEADVAPQVAVVQAQEVAPQPAANPNAPPLEREGPLVLRINQLPPRPAPPAAPEVPEQQRRQHRPPGRGRGVGNARRAAGPRFDERGEPMFDAPNGPNAQGNDEEARQRWVQMFVQMALNDEEDLVEWEDGEEDHARWEIPVGR
jgi:E3 ubiquitin-protein ligase RNF14